MTEYQLVARFKDKEIRDRVMPMAKSKTLADGIKRRSELQRETEDGSLAAYWDGAVIELQAREVGPWTPIS